MNIKKLKTSELLDKIEKEGDSSPDEIFDEIYKRVPFEDTLDRLIELEEEIGNLRRTLRAHAHLDGKVVTEV